MIIKKNFSLEKIFKPGIKFRYRKSDTTVGKIVYTIVRLEKIKDNSNTYRLKCYYDDNYNRLSNVEFYLSLGIYKSFVIQQT